MHGARLYVTKLHVLYLDTVSFRVTHTLVVIASAAETCPLQPLSLQSFPYYLIMYKE